MIKNSTLQKGSAHVIILVSLVLALLGALVYIYWQNVQTKNQSAVENTGISQTVNEDTNKEEVVAMGTIQGSLTYPSDYIPANLEVYATNLETNKEYVTKVHLTGGEYEYGVGYSLDVPAGRYYVYGILSDRPDQRAYYDQHIICGIKVECTDTAKVEVKVEAGQKTADVMVGNWWTVPKT